MKCEFLRLERIYLVLLDVKLFLVLKALNHNWFLSLPDGSLQ